MKKADPPIFWLLCLNRKRQGCTSRTNYQLYEIATSHWREYPDAIGRSVGNFRKRTKPSLSGLGLARACRPRNATSDLPRHQTPPLNLPYLLRADFAEKVANPRTIHVSNSLAICQYRQKFCSGKSMIDRRQLLASMISSSVAWPMVARAQAVRKVARIDVVSIGGPSGDMSLLPAPGSSTSKNLSGCLGSISP